MSTANQTSPGSKIKTNADIVFCIDCTGSMEPCFKGVKEGLTAFVNGLQTAANVNFRLGLIAYRDLNAGDAEPLQEYGFCEPCDISAFRGQLDHLAATGGGDAPESTLDAIEFAANQPWRPHTHHSVIVFTDAPCHPRLHDSTVKRFGLADASVQRVIDALTSHDVLLFLIGPNCAEYRAIELHRSGASFYQLANSEHGLVGYNYETVLERIARKVSISSVPAATSSQPNDKWGEL
jgi:hypothetical protein